MKLIIDANIVFSGILNTKSRIGDLLINSHKEFVFIAPEFLRTEIHKHHPKIIKASGLTIEQVQESEYQIFKDLFFISPEQISMNAWHQAAKLVAGVDEKDAPYVAYALHFSKKIWSGDKQLISGLKAKGFTEFFSTEELFQLRESMRTES